jgi:hypothetical protein
VAYMIREYQLLSPSRDELIQQIAQAVLGAHIILSAQIIPDELARRRIRAEPRDFILDMQSIRPNENGLDVVTHDTQTGDLVYIAVGDETVILKVASQ